MDWTLRHFESDMVFDTFAHLSSQTLKTKPNNTEQKPHFFFPLVRCFSKIKNNKPTKRRRLGRIEKRQKRYEKLCFFGKTEKKTNRDCCFRIKQFNGVNEISMESFSTWYLIYIAANWMLHCFLFFVRFFFEWRTLFLFLFVQIVNTWDCAWVSCFLSIFWKSLFHFFVCLLARINLIWIKIDRWQ